MDCHQILSGACNAGDRCFAVGSVEGVPFTAYAAGCNIVVLASTFERVQIIPGATHNYIRISALDCSTDTGKIAAAYEDKVCIFEPTPLIHSSHPPSHGLEYKWVQTGTLQASSHISSLSWNLEGTRLLTGGTVLELWHEKLKDDDQEPTNVKFEIGGADPRTPTNEREDPNQPDETWECVWKCHTAVPVHHMAFSPDGTLFATSGKSDRLVKVWYENKHLLFPSKSIEHNQSMGGSFLGNPFELNYGFVYVAHPRAVTHISWRKTSKYMPKGSVSNMLVTSCLDNICRIWIETVLPDDGLVNMSQFDPLATQNPKFRTHRHKHRFMQRLKHMKTCFHIRRHAKHQAATGLSGMGAGFGGLGTHNGLGQPPIPTLPSTYSVHDFHSYGYHGTGVQAGLHFHLAASINAETDIPLVPSMQTNDPSMQPNFILHWLNNKEMHYSLQTEALMKEMARKLIEKEDNNPSMAENSHSEHSDEHQQPPVDEMKKKLSKMNKSMSHDDSQQSDEHFQQLNHPHQNQNRSHSIGGNAHTLSNTTSIQSLLTDGQGGNGAQSIGNITGGTDSLDMKIESLLKDWHHNPDLLFSIHPIDGSFLIWVVEWLDEYHPSSFRQAQVSFSTRIPSAFPLGDAMSMSTTVSLYSSAVSFLNVRDTIIKSVKGSTNLEQSRENVGNNNDDQLPSVQEEDTTGENEGDDGNENKSTKTANDKNSVANDSGNINDGHSTNDLLIAPPSPTISMVTKHANGTLNLWQLTFADKSKFSQVLSIGHASRASGHRFRVNDITCHPVLPLLLTTSHHNVPELMEESEGGSVPKFTADKLSRGKDVCVPLGFCSELILWRVDAVGPLSQSGGVSELARINSPEISAFSNVAWIPTLLPSTTLGNLSNSPSACFVASDGESLRVYQAVIDARTLLAEISSSERRHRMMDSMMSLSECSSINENLLHQQSPLHDKIKIVSQQSTARPGCIIQLDAIADATHDWQNTQFLHVFQEQLITGERNDPDSAGLIENLLGTAEPGLMEKDLDAMVDLQRNSVFEEPFYIVVLERTPNGTTLHMWRIVIASQPISADELTSSMMYVPDSNIIQDLDESEMDPKMARPSMAGLDENMKNIPGTADYCPRVNISTTKVCTQELPLPEGVDVVHAAPAAGHLSSSSIYPACFAPYIIVTACSDSNVRFWKCNVSKKKSTESGHKFTYDWCEWEMIRKDQESSIDVHGQLLHISAAYSGRIACAYKYGKSFTRPSKDPDSRFVNLVVAIYECESTGGSEWVLEDKIDLKNIHLPKIEVDPHLDLSYLYDHKSLAKKQRLQQVLHPFAHDDLVRTPGRVTGSQGSINNNGDITPDGPKANGMLAVPSFSTLQSLRKSITEHGNTCPLTQKHLVQLDWVSKEDGSHILTVAVGSKIMLFTPVSSDIAQANMKAMKESQTANRPLLRKASSLARPHFNDEIRWMKLRQIELKTADGLPPLPMQISWVRDGIFVVGMDSEMHVYSQWKPRGYEQILLHHLESLDNYNDARLLKDEDLRSLTTESNQKILATVSSMPHLSRVSVTNLQLFGAQDKKKKITSTATSPGGLTNQIGQDVPMNYDYMNDFGLFEASRIACPVLPQYHPKQLMELLNSGKIRWVKAILAHLVRCISGSCAVRGNNPDEESLNRQRGWSRSRTLSVSYPAGTTSPLEQRGSTTQIPEELTLDYAEITSIPPLPLWTLLAADKENLSQQQKEEVKDYNELFESNVTEDNLDDLLEEDGDSSRRYDRRSSIPERQFLSHFGPRQGQILSRLLTHTHLPGLSSLDQMHLLALADTVSTCNTDFAERFANDAAKTAIAKENLTGNPSDSEAAVSTDSLDDCGLRFLMAMKHFNYLILCLPLAQRTQHQKQGVGTSNIAWAFHSESEEDLLNLIPNYAKGQVKWATLRELGVGWWLRNQTLLKTCVEKLAKSAFQRQQDPLDAALFYIAMKKKSVVWGLYKNKRDDKMTAFFANNFAEDRWRKAALKNAFALLGKQRFEHAVAFFLLAGSLNDAIEVCLNKLDDLQLALIIARLYEGEHDNTPPTYKKLLYEEILGSDKNGENQDLDRVHPDPFLRSMSLWILKDHTGALSTLLQNGAGILHKAYDDEDPLLHPEFHHIGNSHSATTANPNVFNFYVYLRTHPLIIRQHIATTAQEKKKNQVVLSGFSFGGSGGLTRTDSMSTTMMGQSAKNKSSTMTNDKQLHLEDFGFTPLERQLYFTTAHGHFKAGCPALALEVLSKLPTKVIDTDVNESDDNISVSTAATKVDTQSNLIATGTLDWGQTADSLDWGAPITNQSDDAFKIVWDEEEKDDSDDDGLGMKMDGAEKKEELDNTKNVDESESTGQLDIMAQQLKFIACLKILMEELSTLATGFEVDGGQLRYQLYVWLEREVEALKQLCNYSTNDSGDSSNVTLEDAGAESTHETPLMASKFHHERPTLHEILLQEKHDFEAKVARAAKRKRWLKANETLLRTLLSYCSLHGASGGGLASVRMELVLLLQELQQEKTQQQLLSPLPFPTTLPLLSACVAGNKTVIADPIRYLQQQTSDMLQTIVELRGPPVGMNDPHTSDVFILRDLSVALSACIYQSLCDSDTFSVKQLSSNECHSPGMETIAKLNASCRSTHLMANAAAHTRRRKYSTDEPISVSTPPAKWPGVTNLRALLAREKDEDTPRLNVLLSEAFIASYTSLLVYALSTCDCHILYRLVGQKFTDSTWALLYGGGVKKLLRKATSHVQAAQQMVQQQLQQQQSTDTTTESDASGTMWNTVTSITKHRVKLNMKILGQFGSQQSSSNMKEDKPTYREQFVPPEMSMVSYFLTKPMQMGDKNEDDYDSADSAVSDLDDDDDDEDVFNDPLSNDPKKLQAAMAIKKHKKDNTEHLNPNSLSWYILRLAILKHCQNQLHQFISVAGLELQELPVCSPLIHGTLRSMAIWQDLLKDELENRGPATADFIPGCFVEDDTKGPALNKYRTLLDKNNTPFSPSAASAGPSRRLWSFMVRQEVCQDVFIRAIFGKRKTFTFETTSASASQPVTTINVPSVSNSVVDFSQHSDVNVNLSASANKEQNHQQLLEPVRIIHKDQEAISAFCLNHISGGMMALATPKDLQEIDISLLLESPNWLEDECELDILNLARDVDTMPSSGFLVIHAAGVEKSAATNQAQNLQQTPMPISPQPGMAPQSGRGASIVLKHKIDNIKRMSAHPLMPLYITGAQDGSVQMWEWGHQQAVCTPRPPGTFAKVTRCRFSQHGNKFGIADGDGKLSLWQAGLASTCNRAFFTHECHNKLISDFVFLGSCSLVATAGHSSESKNVAIWDTLLPAKKAMVSSFACHDQGASSLAYAPQHQLLISAGKKGDVCIFDVRQRTLRYRFQAHDNAIKCLAIDPHEEIFVTGSADGDIKIWALPASTNTPLFFYPGEHKHSSFFKHTGQGVTQIFIDQGGRMFSCGADGSMKVRSLPDRDTIVNSIY